VVQQAKKVAALGLMPMTQGNLSLRDPESGLVLITPHDHPYEAMTEDDIVVVDVEGRVVEGRRAPSFETPVHCVVYRQRPAMHGIVHTEPIWTNAFGVVHKPIAPVFVSMALDVGGEVPVMPFEISGSEEFAYHMLEWMGDKKAVIWANHGLLTIGETLHKAVHCTVMVESAAKIYTLALQIGGQVFPVSVPLRALRST
jgi:L-fuculose-phosphate aldolase